MVRKRYTPTFKAQVVQELLKEEKTVAQVAAEHGIHPTQLIKWRATALQGLPSLFARLAALYEEIGRLTTQVTWLKRKSGLDPVGA